MFSWVDSPGKFGDIVCSSGLLFCVFFGLGFVCVLADLMLVDCGCGALTWLYLDSVWVFWVLCFDFGLWSFV